MAVRPPRSSDLSGWARRLSGRPPQDVAPRRPSVSLAPTRTRSESSGRVRSVSLRDRSENVSAMVVELEIEAGKACASVGSSTATANSMAAESSIAAESLEPGDALMLVWLGRRTIPGIVPGARLRVHGLVTTVRTRPTMFNPAYELLVSEDAR